MKLEFLFLAVLMVPALGLQLTTRDVHPTKRQPGVPQQNASLQLTTSIVQQDLCQDGSMRVWLRLRYTNTGTEPIILGRYSASFLRYAISRDEGAAAKGHNERAVEILLNSFQPNPTHGRTPPSERFVTLKSTEFYELDTKAMQVNYLFLNRSEVQRFRKGTHVLQVTVSTWDEPAVLAEELSVAWRDYGVLWRQNVTSLPMPFKIEKPSSTIKCS